MPASAVTVVDPPKVQPMKPSPPKPPPNDRKTFKTTGPLAFTPTRITTVLDGVNLYHTLCVRKLQNCGSPGSVVVPPRSPVSVNGRVEMESASAKLSLAGGDA